MQALLHSVLPTLPQATTDPCLHWRLLDTHRQVWAVSCGVTAPFSWYTGFYLCPPRVYFPVLCKFCSSVVGLKATSSKRAYAIPKSLKIIKSADTEINKNLKCNQNLLSISLHFEWLFLKKNLQ